MIVDVRVPLCANTAMRMWDDLQTIVPDWEACLAVAREFDDRYSLTEEQQYYVYRFARTVPAGGCTMEIGVCNGKTSSIFAHCAKQNGFEAHGIDGFILENSVEAFNAAMEKVDLPFHLHKGLTGTQPVPGRPDLTFVPWDRELDVLLIDGSHTDPWVTDDIVRWTPFLKPGCVVMFHDYDSRVDPQSGHYETRQAIDRLTADWAMEYFINGLLIKRKPLV